MSEVSVSSPAGMVDTVVPATRGSNLPAHLPIDNRRLWSQRLSHFRCLQFTSLYSNASQMFNLIHQSQSIIQIGLSDNRALSLELRTIGYPHARPDRDTWVSQGLAFGYYVQELSFDPFRSHVAKCEAS